MFCCLVGFRANSASEQAYRRAISYCLMPLSAVIVPIIENWEKRCIRVCFRFCFLFLFVLRAKSSNASNHRTGLNDISYKSSFSRGLNYIRKSHKTFLVFRKTVLKFLIFLLISSIESQRAGLCMLIVPIIANGEKLFIYFFLLFRFPRKNIRCHK